MTAQKIHDSHLGLQTTLQSFEVCWGSLAFCSQLERRGLEQVSDEHSADWLLQVFQLPSAVQSHHLKFGVGSCLGLQILLSRRQTQPVKKWSLTISACVHPVNMLPLSLPDLGLDTNDPVWLKCFKAQPLRCCECLLKLSLSDLFNVSNA